MLLESSGRQNGFTLCHLQVTREAVRERVYLKMRKIKIQQLSRVRSIISFQTEVVALNPTENSVGIWLGPVPEISRNTQ